MQCVLYFIVSDSKVVDHEGKCDYIIVVASKSRRDWSRLISKCADMLLELRVCDDACLEYPIHSLLQHNIEKGVDLIIHEV